MMACEILINLMQQEQIERGIHFLCLGEGLLYGFLVEGGLGEGLGEGLITKENGVWVPELAFLHNSLQFEGTQGFFLR